MRRFWGETRRRRSLTRLWLLPILVVGIGLRAAAVAPADKVDVRTTMAVTLASSQTRVVPGHHVTLTGSVWPAHPGQQVVLEELGASGWRAIGNASLGTTSTFSIDHRFTTKGTYQLRAYLSSDAANARAYSQPMTVAVSGIFTIQHVIIIMQENRSFDQYFGTYPGADGIPGLAGNPGSVPCNPDPTNGGCDQPYHSNRDLGYGGPHGVGNAVPDADCTNYAKRTNCKMDGFVGQAERGHKCKPGVATCLPCTPTSTTQCIDAMGYLDASEIPNYWDYASNFVLQDHMFEPNDSYSLPAHLFLVSEWSAFCTDPQNAFSCTNQVQTPNPSDGKLHYAWTDITYLLHRYGVSWAYYIATGTQPDCENPSAVSCAAVQQTPQTPGLWNPLPSFTDVTQDGQLGNIQSVTNFYTAAQNGTLPSVSWVIPSGQVSEHPPYLVSSGQSYVTGLVNAVMQSPNWDSTAIFLAWDDWGGFYDSAVPPAADQNGYGFRVPAMVISPYAIPGYIDHQTLSFDAYNKFIEDDFLGGQALDPATDGRPDPRPDVRETSPILGDMTSEFNFNQTPLQPLILPVCPTTDLTPTPTCTPAGQTQIHAARDRPH